MHAQDFPPFTWEPLFLSLQVVTIATAITLVVGTALAILLVWRKLPARDFVDAIISSPLILPPTVLGYYLITALGRESAIGRAWERLTGTQIIFTFTGAVIAAAVGSLPLVVRSVRDALDAVEPELVAAARTLGASPRRVLFTVTLPLALPGVIAGAMLGFARGLGDYGITQMVAGPFIDGLGIQNQSTASIYVYDRVFALDDDNALAMALLTTAVGVTLLFLANRMKRRLVPHRG
jgi:molybdate transport system permease protein